MSVKLVAHESTVVHHHHMPPIVFLQEEAARSLNKNTHLWTMVLGCDIPVSLGGRVFDLGGNGGWIGEEELCGAQPLLLPYYQRFARFTEILWMSSPG